MGTISVIATVSAESAATSASYGSFSFGWTGSRTTGEYVGGQPWVLVQSGSLSVSEPTPAETTDGGAKVVNGAQVNPTVDADAQGYDQNASWWNAPSTASFPVSMSAGDVLVKSKYYSGWADLRDGVIDEWGVLFAVDAPPSPNSFAPAAVSWTGRTTKDASVIDVASWVAANCPNYNTSGHANVPPYSDIYDQIRFFPAFAQVPGWEPYERLTPHLSGGAAGNYGRYLAGTYGSACLALCSSSFTTAQKVAIATRLIDNGKQWYDALAGEGYVIPADGGHFQWHLVPMAIYLHASGQTAALATLISDVGGNYKGAFQVTADMLANDFVPHTSGTKPFTWRQRTLGASSVTGLNIKIPALAEDPTWCNFNKLIITRVSDAATATVTATPVASESGGTYTVTIDAHPTPAFTDADVVYFETPHALIAGEYDWSDKGYGVNYNPSPDAGDGYRALNEWSGQVLGLKALGCFPADGTAVQGYVETANAANTPAAGFDHPNHHNIFTTKAGANYAWDAEFWTDHAATILA